MRSEVVLEWPTLFFQDLAHSLLIRNQNVYVCLIIWLLFHLCKVLLMWLDDTNAKIFPIILHITSMLSETVGMEGLGRIC